MFSNITARIRLLFRKDKESYLRLYRMLGFFPRNMEIYQQALRHKSSSIKAGKGRLINNERLEFLGDAILDAVVADIVYKKFEGKREGFLTNTRSKIVQRETLNRVAVKIGLDKLIKYTTRQSSHNSYMCGNAFEALIGAIYLDQGYRACKKFMEERIITPYLDLEKVSRKEMNFKSKLIEWSQKNKFELAFNLMEQSVDSDQSPMFETQATIENIPAGTGKGYSKKESQQEAAHEALRRIKSDSRFIEAIFAAKAAREELQGGQTDGTTENDGTNHPASPNMAALREETEQARDDEMERIIAEAEEAAFQMHRPEEKAE